MSEGELISENAINTTSIAKEALGHLQDRPMKSVKPEERMTANNPDIPRTPPVRLERHLMAKALLELRKLARQTSLTHVDNAQHQVDDQNRPILKYRRTPEQSALIHDALNNVQTIKINLDQLNQQITDPEQTTNIIVNNEQVGELTLPFRTYDLHPPKEGGKDDRIPIFGIGGGPSATEQNTALWMALALAGKKVIVAPYPEKIDDKPDDIRKRIRKTADGSFKMHQQIFSQAIQSFAIQKDIEEADILGHSLGGAIALGIATEDQPPVKLRNVIAAEPIGFEDKGLLSTAIDFAGKQGLLLTGRHVEDKIKMLLDGAETPAPKPLDLLLIAQIAGKKVFTPEMLKKVKASGKVQIWNGTNSPVVNWKAVERVAREANNSDTKTPIELYRIVGGDHSAIVTHALGFVEVLEQQLEESSSEGRKIRAVNLSSSGAETLLKKYSTPA